MIQLSEQSLPSEAVVHIWSISLDDPALDLPEILSDDELSRFSKIKHQKARTAFLRSRTSMRLILASYLACTGAELSFSYNANGKPELFSDSAGNLRFNLSHSGTYCLLAVTAGNEIGVDIEQFHRARDHAALAARFFTSEEHDLLQDSEDEMLFYRMWVLKEASVKARGMKLLAGLDRFECLLSENNTLTVSDKQQQEQDGWSLKQWQPGESVIAALVVQGKDIKFLEKKLTNTV
jgi:4'-phosphopantetheinyl transferase